MFRFRQKKNLFPFPIILFWGNLDFLQKKFYNIDYIKIFPQFITSTEKAKYFF